jgi:leucyl/phenylalanyl-tRNA--protein transferase
MIDLPWIAGDADPAALPDAEQALSSPNGLLAVGGRLSPEWLLAAYRKGAFPWFERDQPILWWSPDPRAVLWTDELKISRSLRRTIGKRLFAITADTSFDAVISACAEPRSYTDATWITPSMRTAFNRMHALGFAHSFEAWRDGRLVGGLYGLAIGRVFFGESMFSRVSDASKVAFAHAVAFLQSRSIFLIDCQVPSAHLASLGATSMPRRTFLSVLRRHAAACDRPGSWMHAFADFARPEAAPCRSTDAGAH